MCKNNLRIFLFVLLLVILPACQRQPKLGIDVPIRILPLGDSITEGVCDIPENCIIPAPPDDPKTPTTYNPSGLEACSWSMNPNNPKIVSYRAFLRDELVAKGYKLTYVGSVEVIPGLAHEGHTGWTIADLDYCVQNADWLQKAQPDMILLHIGTNDVLWNHTPDQIEADLSQLVKHIYAKLPKTTSVIIAQIIPTASGITSFYVDLSAPATTIIAQYNARISGAIDQLRKEGMNISYVDMSGTVQKDNDLASDGIHPISTTYERMANIWFDKITEILTQK